MKECYPKYKWHSEIVFLWRIHGVTLRDIVHSCEITNVESLLFRIEISQLWCAAMWAKCLRKIGEKKAAQNSPKTRWSDSICDGLLSSSWGASRSIWDCCEPKGVSNPPGAVAPETVPREKACVKMNEWMNIHPYRAKNNSLCNYFFLIFSAIWGALVADHRCKNLSTQIQMVHVRKVCHWCRVVNGPHFEARTRSEFTSPNPKLFLKLDAGPNLASESRYAQLRVLVA